MAPRGASAKYIGEIVALIRGGMTGAEACAAKAEYPNYRSLSEWATKNGRVDELRAAWRDREKSDNARMKTNLIYSEEQYDAAIELLTRNPRKSLRQQAHAIGLDLPGRRMIYQRARRDPEFAARFAAAKKSVRTVISKHTPRAPKPVYKSDLLRRALLAHPIWKAARRAVPYSEYSEDVVQEIVLAVLEGELSETDIAAKGNSLGFKRLRVPAGMKSLDEPTFVRNRESERDTLIDTIATDSEITFY
jgi:hypothetical protein